MTKRTIVKLYYKCFTDSLFPPTQSILNSAFGTNQVCSPREHKSSFCVDQKRVWPLTSDPAAVQHSCRAWTLNEATLFFYHVQQINWIIVSLSEHHAAKDGVFLSLCWEAEGGTTEGDKGQLFHLRLIVSLFCSVCVYRSVCFPKVIHTENLHPVCWYLWIYKVQVECRPDTTIENWIQPVWTGVIWQQISSEVSSNRATTFWNSQK